METEAREFTTQYCTTTTATPWHLCLHDLTLDVGEAIWACVRVEASNSSKSWYTEMVLFARRATLAAPKLYKKALISFAPEGGVSWSVDFVVLSDNEITLAVTGAAGSVVDWSVSTHVYKRYLV